MIKRIAKWLILISALVVILFSSIPVFAGDNKSSPNNPIEIVPDWLQNPKYKEPVTTKVETNKYEINISNEIVVVGKGTSTFIPEITLYRWDKECFVKLGEPTVNGNVLAQKNSGSTITGSVIQWASKDIQFEFYPIVADSQNEFGSFEYEITIANNKAGTNQPLSNISFPITSSGLDFFYQPALTQEEINKGAYCPDNVVGSYAVYHSTKSNHIVGQVNYGTGKAFHIYRPMLIDNAGNTIYADLTIANGYLTIDFSKIQSWLDKAKYPVVIDPEFGYTTKGAGAFTVIANINTGISQTLGMAFALAVDGNATKMTAALKTTTGSEAVDLWFAIYRENSAGADTHDLVASAESLNVVVSKNSIEWYSINFANEFLAADDYILAALGNGEDLVTANNFVYVYGDNIGGAQRCYIESAAGAGSYATRKAENPWTEVDSNTAYKLSIYCTYDLPSVAATVTTNVATSVEDTTATLSGNITVMFAPCTTCNARGFEWGTTSNVTTPAPTYQPRTLAYTSNWTEYSSNPGYGIGIFTYGATGLPTGTTIYYRAYAHSTCSANYTAGWGYGDQVSFLTKPAAPTNVAATDGETAHVTITWTKSTGATGYHVYRDGAEIGGSPFGDVATADDAGAAAGTIDAGTADATDGTSTAHVVLSIAGEHTHNGTTYTYTVIAHNATGDSDASAGDTGYRGVGAITYAWYRSAGDSDDTFGAIGGGTTDPYNDTAAPAPTVTPGVATALDGAETAHVQLSITGEGAFDGAGRYYYCKVSATGAADVDTNHNRGYRSVGALTYQWRRSAGITDDTFGDIGGGTTDPYDDAGAPAPTVTPGVADATDGGNPLHVVLSIAGESSNHGAVRYYYCVISATGAVSQDTTHDSGYRDAGALSYQWQRSGADADGGYGALGGATTDPYNDTTAPAPVITAGNAVASDGTFAGWVELQVVGESQADGAGRYYYCVVSAPDAVSQNTTHDRGYRNNSGFIFYEWFRSAGDADAGYATIAGEGGTTDPYNDVNAPADGSGRWYYCTLSATGAAAVDTTHDRGYRSLPPTIDTLPCSGTGTNWAVVNGVVTSDGGAPIATVGFEYGTTIALGSTVSKAGSFSTGTHFSYTLTGLSPASPYFFRATGGGTYGDTLNFATTGSPAIWEYWNTTCNATTIQTTSSNITFQTFTTGTTAHTVYSVRLYLKRTLSPGNVYASIRYANVGATEPTGLDLVSKALNGNAFSTSYTWYEFIFDTTYSLEASKQYAIVLQVPSGDGADYVEWAGCATGGLANGIAGHSHDMGITWTSDAPTDKCFELWGYASLLVSNPNVFTNYLETGDWLVTCLITNTYAPYYNNNDDPAAYFYLQLIDPDTNQIKASTPIRYWERQPMGLYLRETEARSLTWQGAYNVRIQYQPTAAIYQEAPIQAIDWRGDDLKYLDQWIRVTAANLQIYYGEYDANTQLFVDAVYLVKSNKGTVLNEDGGILYARSIPELTRVRPSIFENVQQVIGYAAGTYTGAGLPPDWTTTIGTVPVNTVTNIATTFGIDSPKGLAGAILVIIYLIVAAVVGLSHPYTGMAFGLGFLFIGYVFGILYAGAFFVILAMIIVLGVIKWVGGLTSG